jgi:hypothetical protein
LNGKPIKDRPVTVNEARPRKEHRGGGRHYSEDRRNSGNRNRRSGDRRPW